MKTSYKALLSGLLLTSVNEQLHAWYPGENIYHLVIWMTQSQQTNPAKTPDSVDVPCNNHKVYSADCTECNKLTKIAAAQKESELRANQQNFDIPCGNPHTKYDPTCEKCNQATRKAYEQKNSQLRADQKNQDVPCNNHKTYQADCAECNKLTRKAADQKNSSLQADKKNATIPCNNHKTYRADCSECNKQTRAFNRNTR